MQQKRRAAPPPPSGSRSRARDGRVRHLPFGAGQQQRHSPAVLRAGAVGDERADSRGAPREFPECRALERNRSERGERPSSRRVELDPRRHCNRVLELRRVPGTQLNADRYASPSKCSRRAIRHVGRSAAAPDREVHADSGDDYDNHGRRPPPRLAPHHPAIYPRLRRSQGTHRMSKRVGPEAVTRHQAMRGFTYGSLTTHAGCHTAAPHSLRVAHGAAPAFSAPFVRSSSRCRDLLGSIASMRVSGTRPAQARSQTAASRGIVTLGLRGQASLECASHSGYHRGAAALGCVLLAFALGACGATNSRSVPNSQSVSPPGASARPSPARTEATGTAISPTPPSSAAGAGARSFCSLLSFAEVNSLTQAGYDPVVHVQTSTTHAANETVTVCSYDGRGPYHSQHLVTALSTGAASFPQVKSHFDAIAGTSLPWQSLNISGHAAIYTPGISDSNIPCGRMAIDSSAGIIEISTLGCATPDIPNPPAVLAKATGVGKLLVSRMGG
jgi:hypothetical protein